MEDSERPNEFDESWHDKETIKGAILSEPIAALRPAAPISVRPNASVLEAVQVMNQHKTGCVCVREGERLVGIFTERDILKKVLEQGLDVRNTPVALLMTKNPETLGRQDKIAYALSMMHVGGYRHIPLVEDGKLTGIISIKDIAEFVVELFPDGVLNLPPRPSLGIPTEQDGG